jgi:Copper type II ascorbate-dependent monooxygenase, C-terminal domain
MAVRPLRLGSVCLAALVFAAAACASDSDDADDEGESDDGATDDGDGDGDGDGADDGAADDGDGADDGGGNSGGDSWTVDWGPVMVDPGVEKTMCVRKRLPTDRPIRVGQIVNQLGLASHHMIVYRLAGESETDEPEECDPFVDVLDPAAGAPLAVTQKSEETIALPPGVAFTLEPGQLIRIELHFINAADQPQELRASSTFVEIPEDEFEQEADFLFVGNPDINIGAGETATLATAFLPLPPELANIQIFAVTGHEHQWGTGVTASMKAGANDEGTPIYEPENFQWDEPETIYHDPPMTLPEGGGFSFTCTWDNQSAQDVDFGESVDDEMCFFWAYYFPSQGARICFHTTQFGGHDICCPSLDPDEDAICQLIDTFLSMQ